MNDKVRLRMCAGCRERFHQNELLRVCKISDEIFVDKDNKLGGRGAYICSKECLKTAQKNRQLNKILKSNVPDEIFDILCKEL